MNSFLTTGQPWHIEHGDAMDVLSRMPDDSVDCVVTSPPYFGLRAYGTEPRCWGGDPACAHDWGDVHPPGWRVNDNSPGAISGRFDTERGSAINRGVQQQKQYRTGLTSQTCATCGCWRGELGLEPTPDLFVSHLVDVLRACRRVLSSHGSLWVNMGDSSNGSGGAGGDYAPRGKKAGRDPYPGRDIPGLKPKDMVGVPWMLALALRSDGWTLRNAIIWDKTSGLPESVRDRCTRSHEYIFHLSKSRIYFYDWAAVAEEIIDEHGEITVKNLRSVWALPRSSYRDGAHFATFPVELPERCIRLSTSTWGVCTCHGLPIKRRYVRRQGWGTDTRLWTKRYPLLEPESHSHSASGIEHALPAIVLDPFCGAASTGVAALAVGRRFLGIELSHDYVALARQRLRPKPILKGWETTSGPIDIEQELLFP